MENDKLDQAIWGLERKFPEYSVRLWVTGNSSICLYAILVLFLFAMVIAPYKISLLLFYLLNSLYLLSQTFKLLLLVIGAFLYKKEEKDLAIPKELPVYTILLPVYKEDKILDRLVNSISDIDYPQNILDVKLLIEEDDSKTLLALKKIKLPKFFEVIKVPVSYPRTKPKACNYGLQFAKGKYVTVYDAEIDRIHSSLSRW
jgi:glycosyltransferase XagB